MKKILVTLGLTFALLVSVAAAGDLSQMITAGSYSTQISVPNAGSAIQWAGAESPGSAVINQGPLGNYTAVNTSPFNGPNTPQRIYASGAIPAGNYSVYLWVGGGGFSAIHIGW
jgi:hypothetical protein